MKTKILYSTIFALLSLTSFAQTAADALRFSQSFNGGTARFVSLGGAFGALGGDFTALSYNPAGLGVYRTSEFTITPSFKNRSISSTYNGTSSDDSRNRLAFDNIGFVLSFKPSKESETGFNGVNLAFGYNRTNDFYSNSIAKGENTTSSMMHYFAGVANGTNYSDLTIYTDENNTYDPFNSLGFRKWDAILAWNTYLVDTIPELGKNSYWASIYNGEGVLQQKAISKSGSIGEYVISLGTNISNKFYLGATIGISDLYYKETSTYSEDAFVSNDTLPNGDRFNYSDYRQTLEIQGTGYNLKVGVLYKPIEGLRLGLAVHTPTFYNLEDTYSASLSTNFKYGNSRADTPNNRYEYDLETPFKIIASTAYIFKDLGLISFDYEHVNYSSMRFRNGGDGDNFADMNSSFSDIYRSANNIRIGGELKVNDIYLRAGYALYSNPYKGGVAYEDNKRTIISGGIGYRSGNFFADAAYMYSIQKEGYVFYNLNNEDGSPAINPVSTKTTEGKFLVTLGFKF